MMSLQSEVEDACPPRITLLHSFNTESNRGFRKSAQHQGLVAEDSKGLGF